MKALFTLSALLSLGGCLSDSTPTDDADACSGAQCPPDTTAGATWFLSCGDPVCRGWTDIGVALCTTEKSGDTCGQLDQRCDPKDDCGALLVCATSDPRQQPGGCPRSRRELKQDIRYLDDAGLRSVKDEVLATRLATWSYRWEPGRERLGFIIDDRPESPAVDPHRDMVDLYGFTSLAIGAIQAQAKEIEQLRARLDQLEGAHTCE